MPRGNGVGPGGGGGGQGGGRGVGRGRGQGPRGGAFRGGPQGICVCPACGYTEPHPVGQPCSQKTCPKCGVGMFRG